MHFGCYTDMPSLGEMKKINIAQFTYEKYIYVKKVQQDLSMVFDIWYF